MHSLKLVLVQFYHDDVIYPFKNMMCFNMTLFKLHICSTLQQRLETKLKYMLLEKTDFLRNSVKHKPRQEDS